MSPVEHAAFAERLTPRILTRRGVVAGEARPTPALTNALRAVAGLAEAVIPAKARTQ
jgi:hypothetical protein